VVSQERLVSQRQLDVQELKMYNKNITQDRTGLWLIRPKGSSGGAILRHAVLPFSISTSGPHTTMVNQWPNPLIPIDDCFTLAPLTFPSEKILNVDLTKNVVSCFFANGTITGNLTVDYTKLAHGCDASYSWSSMNITITFGFKDQYGQDFGYLSTFATGTAHGANGTETSFYMNPFSLSLAEPGPRYLGAIIPYCRWIGGGGALTITGNMVFQYIDYT
jgi:hypothetical protein